MAIMDIKIGNKKGKYKQENISIISSPSVGIPPTILSKVTAKIQTCL